jgi:hypothetical protein
MGSMGKNEGFLPPFLYQEDKNENNLFAAAALPIAIFFATSAFAHKKIPWTDVPPAVQKTITEYAEGGKSVQIQGQ